MFDGVGFLMEVAEVVAVTSAGAEFEVEKVVADEADLSATFCADFHGVFLCFA